MVMVMTLVMMMLTMLFSAAGSLHKGASSLHCHRVHVQVLPHLYHQDYFNVSKENVDDFYLMIRFSKIFFISKGSIIFHKSSENYIFLPIIRQL